MIVIIDYDMGNMGSIKNMLHKIGYNDVTISRDCAEIESAEKLILPGVGAFDQGISNLKKYGIVDSIRKAAIDRHVPIMGICLGMQLLGRSSEEGTLEGLDLVPFDSKRFQLSNEYKVPHMGWSDVTIIKDAPIVENMHDVEQRFYFVHSYHAVCDSSENVLMTCNYGYEFAAAVIKDNIFGFQFHPEKSHKYGMELFKNFVKV